MYKQSSAFLYNLRGLHPLYIYIYIVFNISIDLARTIFFFLTFFSILSLLLFAIFLFYPYLFGTLFQIFLILSFYMAFLILYSKSPMCMHGFLHVIPCYIWISPHQAMLLSSYACTLTILYLLWFVLLYFVRNSLLRNL